MHAGWCTISSNVCYAYSESVCVRNMQYYKYELNAPYGSVGPHSLTAATTKGDLLLCLIVSANEKQWQKAESKLRTLVDTFRA